MKDNAIKQIIPLFSQKYFALNKKQSTKCNKNETLSD